jgi:hypothetical protein
MFLIETQYSLYFKNFLSYLMWDIHRTPLQYLWNIYIQLEHIDTYM